MVAGLKAAAEAHQRTKAQKQADAVVRRANAAQVAEHRRKRLLVCTLLQHLLVCSAMTLSSATAHQCCCPSTDNFDGDSAELRSY